MKTTETLHHHNDDSQLTAWYCWWGYTGFDGSNILGEIDRTSVALHPKISHHQHPKDPDRIMIMPHRFLRHSMTMRTMMCQTEKSFDTVEHRQSFLVTLCVLLLAVNWTKLVNSRSLHSLLPSHTAVTMGYVKPIAIQQLSRMINPSCGVRLKKWNRSSFGI